jgi:hypothetical protein
MYEQLIFLGPNPSLTSLIELCWSGRDLDENGIVHRINKPPSTFYVGVVVQLEN